MRALSSRPETFSQFPIVGNLSWVSTAIYRSLKCNKFIWNWSHAIANPNLHIESSSHETNADSWRTTVAASHRIRKFGIGIGDAEICKKWITQHSALRYVTVNVETWNIAALLILVVIQFGWKPSASRALSSTVSKQNLTNFSWEFPIRLTFESRLWRLSVLQQWRDSSKQMFWIF